MPTFNFNFSPSDAVYVVIDSDTEDASISIKRAEILENRVTSYQDNSDPPSIINKLEYLVLLIDDSKTTFIDTTNIFETKEEAIDFIRENFEITPTPTPSTTATPTPTSSITPTPTPSTTATPTPTSSITPTPTPSMAPPQFITLEYSVSDNETVGFFASKEAAPLDGPITVNWGDGTTENITTVGGTHQYANAGTYTVSITGGGIEVFNVTGETAVTRCTAMEIETLKDLSNCFNGCLNLVEVPNTIPSNIENMSFMFTDATSFNDPNISDWDTSNVTNMRSMFEGASSFNQDLNSWDTGMVEDMRFMFRGATSFNQDLNSWNTGNVMTMEYMFSDTDDFNGIIGSWDTSNVNSMAHMFNNAISFNQDLNSWNTGNVNNMSNMFLQAANFNGDITGWDTSNVTNMDLMFAGASSFNQDLSGWCVTNITSKPTSFDAATPSWTEPRPVWGTCP
jgi:surface protein